MFYYTAYNVLFAFLKYIKLDLLNVVHYFIYFDSDLQLVKIYEAWLVFSQLIPAEKLTLYTLYIFLFLGRCTFHAGSALTARISKREKGVSKKFKTAGKFTLWQGFQDWTEENCYFWTFKAWSQASTTF